MFKCHKRLAINQLSTKFRVSFLSTNGFRKLFHLTFTYNLLARTTIMIAHHYTTFDVILLQTLQFHHS